MKLTKRARLIGAALVLAVAVGKATPVLLSGAFTTVNNSTNNTSAVVVGNFSLPRGTFIFGNNGLTDTHAETNLVQLTLDGSNYVTVGTFTHSTTNATNEAYTLPYSSVTILMRISTITTNNVQMLSLYQQ